MVGALGLLVLPLSLAAQTGPFTVTFSAGPNGALSGATVQSVYTEVPGAPVTALPETGHHFAQWTQAGVPYSTENPLTLTGVTADLDLTAEFAVDTFTVQVAAGAHGTISGPAAQTVAVGDNAAPVTATAEAGWHFLHWTFEGAPYSTQDPLTVVNVSADMTLTAEFAVDTHTVRFQAGPGGALAGDALQTVEHSGSSMPVAALADLGYHFVRWTFDGAGSSTDNPLTVAGVVADVLVAAEFAVNTYTVSFAAAEGGAVQGVTQQTLVQGGTTSAVTAVPGDGHHFVGWVLAGLGYSTQNPLTVSGVTADMALTAEFALNPYTVTFEAGANGGLTGATVQVVPHGSGTSLVSAVPDTGHHFVRWLVGNAPYSIENPIAVAAVTTDMALTAEFALNTYSVTFLAAANGALAGTPAQTVPHGVNASPVAAVPAVGYHFRQWLQDGALFSTDNPLTLKNVTGDMILTAEFEINTYTVTFIPGPHGGLAGTPTQRLAHGSGTTAVTAVPNTGYHVLRWALGGVPYATSPTIMIPAVTSDMALTAEFEINSYTVRFTAGANGSLTGTPVQILTHGSTALPVTAEPAVGYHFLRWTLGGDHFSTGNPLVVANVTSDMALTAEFELNVYPVSFTPAANGSVAGAPAQMIPHGSNAEAVTAVPATGYHVLRWTLGGEEYSLDNPINVLNVTAPMALVAEFEINSYTVTFLADAHGAVVPAAVQAVTHGSSAGPVLAEPAVGYHFLRWTLGGALFSTQNPLTVGSVVGDMTLTAESEINIYTVRFLAAAHGRLVGETTQQIAHGSSTTPVEAIADLEFMFALWNDGFAINPRVVSNVTGDLTLTAQFRAANAVSPAGAFLARVNAEDVAAGLGLWDLSGHYQTQVATAALTLDIVHDTKGKITGTGTLATAAKDGEGIAIPVAVKGSARGSGGAVTVLLTAAGSHTGTPAEPGLKASASVTMNLALDISHRRLLGAAVLSQKVGNSALRTPAYCELDIPQNTDGSYEILFQLVQAGTRMTGTAVLTLSNAADYLFAVKGTYPGDACVLALTGHKTDPPAKGIRISATIRTLEGNAAHLDAMTATGYGQTVSR